MFQKIFQCLPRQFMGEFKCPDQPLLFEFRERTLLSQGNGLSQLREGFEKVLKALHPADVLPAHRVSPFFLADVALRVVSLGKINMQPVLVKQFCRQTLFSNLPDSFPNTT